MYEEFRLKANEAIYDRGSEMFDLYITKKYFNPSLEDDEYEVKRLAEKALDGGYEEEISAELGYFVIIEAYGDYDKANQYLAEMIEAGWLTLESVA